MKKKLLKLLGGLTGVLLIGAIAFYLVYLRGVERPKIAMEPIEFAGVETPGQHDCFWMGPVTYQAFNTSFPDEGTIYWPTAFEFPADDMNAHIEISGNFPRARYMSYHTYTRNAVPYDRLPDVDITAAEGAQNPFLTGNYSDEQQYVIKLFPGERPANAPKNAIYLGPMDDVSATPFILRNYVPEIAGDPSGGAGLPKLALVRANGERVEGAALCDLINSPPVGDPKRTVYAPVIPVSDYQRLMKKQDIRASLLDAEHK